MQPMVSVVMPAYNSERFIEEAIRSVMAQTLEDWELVVVDDCSGDGTRAIVERLAEEDGRIRLVAREKNGGVASTRNLGIERSRGRYVALLDSDDIWLAQKLERQVEVAEKSGAGITYCSYAIVDEAGTRVCEDFVVPDATSYEDTLTKSVMSCSTAMIRSEVAKEHRFSDKFYHEDLVYWLDLLGSGIVALGVTDVLAEYRQVEGSRASRKFESAVQRWRVYRDYCGYSVGRSISLFARYVRLGMRKYKRLPGGAA